MGPGMGLEDGAWNRECSHSPRPRKGVSKEGLRGLERPEKDPWTRTRLKGKGKFKSCSSQPAPQTLGISVPVFRNKAEPPVWRPTPKSA